MAAVILTDEHYPVVLLTVCVCEREREKERDVLKILAMNKTKIVDIYMYEKLRQSVSSAQRHLLII